MKYQLFIINNHGIRMVEGTRPHFSLPSLVPTSSVTPPMTTRGPFSECHLACHSGQATSVPHCQTNEAQTLWPAFSTSMA